MDLSTDHLQFLNQFWWSLFILAPMALIARTVVAGTRYSPILIIVVFGLLMGFVLAASSVSEAGVFIPALIGLAGVWVEFICDVAVLNLSKWTG